MNSQPEKKISKLTKGKQSKNSFFMISHASAPCAMSNHKDQANDHKLRDLLWFLISHAPISHSLSPSKVTSKTNHHHFSFLLAT